jgi:hydrogenase maturation protease
VTRLTIIGYGNPLRGDDGAGWLIASRLIERQSNTRRSKTRTEDSTIEVLALQQLTPELAQNISVSGSVIFIDACCDIRPGHVSCLSLISRKNGVGKQRQSKNATEVASHHLDPSGLLAFTYSIYGVLPKTGLLITVGGESFGHKEGLSQTVAAAVPIIEQILEAHITNNSLKVTKK